jgi:MFS family permease
MTPDRAQASSTTFGWVIVASVAAILAVAMGQLINGLSVFAIPLEQEFGWARGPVALINSAGLIGLAIGGVVMGTVADRAPIRYVSLAGVSALGVCVALASLADQLWQFYVLFFVAGFFAAGLFVPLISLVGSWFPVGAGLAIGIASAGQALGQGGVPFATAFLIDAFGWRQSFLILGLLSLALLLPLALLIREPARTASAALAPGAEAQVPLSPFVVTAWLSLAVLLCCATMAVPLMHLVPLIQGHGISAPDASGVLFVMLITAIMGRVAFGKLADIIGPVPAYMAASLWQTAAVFAFVGIEDLTWFYIFAPIYGFGYAGVMTGLLITARVLTPAARRSTLMGVIMAFAWLGHGLGGFQAGHFYDQTGHYTMGFGLAALAGAGNLLVVGGLLVTLRRRSAPPVFGASSPLSR